MGYIDKSMAKGIVKRDLRSWLGNASDLMAVMNQIAKKIKVYKSVELREEAVNKEVKKGRYPFFHRYIPAMHSNFYGLIGQSHEVPVSDLSKNKIKKYQFEINKYNHQLHKIRERKINVFIALDDEDVKSESLVVFIFDLHTAINQASSVVNITRHCLERIVQRLGCDNISDALDEILTGIVCLEQSVKSYITRPQRNLSHEVEYKIHVPTKNGALLLSVKIPERKTGNEIMTSTLITWISKKQFFDNQEVTIRNYNYASFINYHLNAPDVGTVIKDWRNKIESLKGSGSDVVEFMINGIHFSSDEILYAIERGKYLDNLISFEPKD